VRSWWRHRCRRGKARPPALGRTRRGSSEPKRARRSFRAYRRTRRTLALAAELKGIPTWYSAASLSAAAARSRVRLRAALRHGLSGASMPAGKPVRRALVQTPPACRSRKPRFGRRCSKRRGGPQLVFPLAGPRLSACRQRTRVRRLHLSTAVLCRHPGGSHRGRASSVTSASFGAGEIRKPRPSPSTRTHRAASSSKAMPKGILLRCSLRAIAGRSWPVEMLLTRLIHRNCSVATAYFSNSHSRCQNDSPIRRGRAFFLPVLPLGFGYQAGSRRRRLAGARRCRLRLNAANLPIASGSRLWLPEVRGKP